MKNIEKYKEKIKIMLGNNINDKGEIIEKLIKLDLKNHKITKEEYDELNNFLKQNIAYEKKKENQVRQEDKKDCYKSSLKVEPIYKGIIGRIAPKRENMIKDIKEEER